MIRHVDFNVEYAKYLVAIMNKMQEDPELFINSYGTELPLCLTP